MICEICNKEFAHLALHIKYAHKDITVKDYYDQYLKKDNEGFCFTCGNPVKFYNLHKGYQHYCNAKCELSDNNVKEKAKQTYKLKTGYEHNMHNPDSKEKVKNTTVEKYGAIGFGSTELSKKALNTFNEKHNTDIEHISDIMHTVPEISEKMVCTKYKNNNGSYMSVEHKEKLLTAASIPDVCKKRVSTRYARYGAKYVSEKAYDKLKLTPLNTYDYANMKDFNNNSICTCHCDKCNNDYQIHLMTLRTRRYANQELCTICNPLDKQYSIGEKELLKFILSVYSGTIIENDRTALDGKEIDIYLPDINIGFEFDGTYWHADPRFYEANEIIDTKGTTAAKIWEHDNEKNLLAESKGIILCRIPEYDWQFDREGIIEFIKEMLE